MNLDAMTSEDLKQVVDDKTADKRLRRYAAYKRAAMGFREDGAIAEALRYETTCDQIYEELPADLRW